jgi:hypothetical protein
MKMIIDDSLVLRVIAALDAISHSSGSAVEEDAIRNEFVTLSGELKSSILCGKTCADGSGELLDAAMKLLARGFFAKSSCADAATNADMKYMRQAIQKSL